MGILAMIICVYGLITGEVSLGIIFLTSLAVFLYNLFTFFNKSTKLTNIGIGVTVVSVILLAYTICYLFLNIDVKTILGL